MTESFPSRSTNWKRPFINTLLFVLIVSLFSIIVSCSPTERTSDDIPPENVFFESNVGAEYTGFTLSFQYPRDLQIGYFSDSGAFGWMIVDADPQEVFWASNQTGNEISILLMYDQFEESNTTPADRLGQMGQGLPAGAQIEEFTESDKQIAYYVNSGQAGAVVVTPNFVFVLFGSYPTEKEAVTRKSMETILHSLEFHDAGNQDFSSETMWGTRKEGSLATGRDRNGYIPLSSASTWEWNQENGTEFTLSIDTKTQDAEVAVDILDDDGNSVLFSGEITFTGKLENRKITLPDNGTYTIKIFSPAGWYGWYTMQIQ